MKCIIVLLNGDHSEAVRESGVESRLYSGGVNAGWGSGPGSSVLVLPAVERQGDREGAVRADLRPEFPLRVLDPSQRPEGRGPGGAVDGIHQGGYHLVRVHQSISRSRASAVAPETTRTASALAETPARKRPSVPIMV